jgi:hypothetical protein
MGVGIGWGREKQLRYVKGSQLHCQFRTIFGVGFLAVPTRRSVSISI